MNSAQQPTHPEPTVIEDESAPKNSGFKFTMLMVVVVILFIIGAIAGILPRWSQRKKLGSQTAELAIQSVSVTNPIPGKSVAGLALPAEIKALQEAPIHARANGYLKRWLVDLGTRVEAGQLLAEIDTPEITQDLARSRAELIHAQAAYDLSKATAARWRELLKSRSVSEQETAEKLSDEALKAAAMDAATAAVRRLEELQSFSKVTAPFPGVITARNIEVGDLISTTSSRELFRLAQTRTLRVFAQVPQSMARAIQIGLVGEVSIPELGNRTLPAKVARTAGAMNTESRTLLVELELDNANGEILSGTYAQVRFAEAKVETPLTLPSNTLLFRPDGLQVAVITPENKVNLRHIVIGRDFGPTIEIIEGISANDRVVINPMDSIVNGATVRIAPEQQRGDGGKTAAH